MKINLDFNFAEQDTKSDEKYPSVRRHKFDNSIVVWHNKRKDKSGVYVTCNRRVTDPEAVKFDSFGNPWCPTCFAENELSGKVDRLGKYCSG